MKIDKVYNSVANAEGEWVSAVPLPWYGLIFKICDCGKKFFTLEGYYCHYGYRHILMKEGFGGR